MNRKLALLMFAIGVGTATAPAFAFSCAYYCSIERKACLSEGSTAAECNDVFQACMDGC